MSTKGLACVRSLYARVVVRGVCLRLYARSFRRLRAKGRDVLNCCYAHCAEDPTFHRRAYWLILHADSPPDASDDLLMVHYLGGR